MIISFIKIFILFAIAVTAFMMAILAASAGDKSYLSDEEAEEQWTAIKKYLHKKEN